MQVCNQIISADGIVVDRKSGTTLYASLPYVTYTAPRYSLRTDCREQPLDPPPSANCDFAQKIVQTCAHAVPYHRCCPGYATDCKIRVTSTQPVGLVDIYIGDVTLCAQDYVGRNNTLERESPPPESLLKKLGRVSNGEREKESWSRLRPLYSIPLLCRGSNGSVVRASV